MVKRPERKQKDRKKVTTEMMRAAVQAHEGADASRHNVLADWKVKAKTAADHRRDWEDLQGTVAMKGTAFYTENQFLDAMLLHVGVHPESRIEKYRAAVVKRQDLDLPVGLRWTQDSGFERRIQGLLAKAREAFIKKRSEDARKGGKKPLEEDDDADDGRRGAITGVMAVKVVKHLTDQGLYMYARGVVVAHGALLRHGEVMAARHKDFFMEGGQWMVKVAGGKGRAADEVDQVKVDGAMQTLAAMHMKGSTKLLFEGWDPSVVLRAIAQVAKAEGWDPNRLWDFHALRHGKAVDNRVVKGMSVAERMQAGRWKTEKIEKMYSRHR